jgi:hypothetical protein
MKHCEEFGILPELSEPPEHMCACLCTDVYGFIYRNTSSLFLLHVRHHTKPSVYVISLHPPPARWCDCPHFPDEETEAWSCPEETTSPSSSFFFPVGREPSLGPHQALCCTVVSWMSPVMDAWVVTGVLDDLQRCLWLQGGGWAAESPALLRDGARLGGLHWRKASQGSIGQSPAHSK